MTIFDITEIEEIKPIRNNSEVMISIVCVIYNHEKYLRDALEGLVMQKTEYSYEIVIHDDASTDNSEEIIREYVQKFPDLFHVFMRKENTWNHPLRLETQNNFCKKFLTGKYVAFCEGDDYWTDPYKLQKQVDFLERNPDYSATVHNVLCVDEKGRFIRNEFGPYPIRDTHIYGLEQVKNFELASQTASLICRNFWKNSSDLEERFILSNLVNEDVKYNIILGLRGKIYYFKDIMSNHRRIFKGDSWTAQTVNKNMLWYFYNSNKRVTEFIKDSTGEQISTEDHLRTGYQQSKNRLKKTLSKEDLFVYLKFLKEFIREKPKGKRKKKNTENKTSVMYRNLSVKHLEMVKMYDLWMTVMREGHSIEDYLQNKSIKTIVIYGMSYLGKQCFYELKNSSIEVKYALDNNTSLQAHGLEIYKLGTEEKQDVDAVIVTSLIYFEDIKFSLKKNGYSNILGIDEIIYGMMGANYMLD